MYRYLYLIDVIHSINTTLNIISVVVFFASLLIFFIYLVVDEDNEEVLRKCKKVLNKKVFIIWSISVLIVCIIPNKLTMYSYALESLYKENNNTELYQDISKFIKQKILEETAKE